MTTFLRLLAKQDKGFALSEACARIRVHAKGQDIYILDPESFRTVPGSPFSYWVSDEVRSLFSNEGSLFYNTGTASVGVSTKDNFRYTRLWLEVDRNRTCGSRQLTFEYPWVPFAMGGNESPYYRDVGVVLNWKDDGAELKAAISEYRGSRGWGYQWSAALNGHDYYFDAGVSWPKRARRFAPQAMPGGCIFSDRGFAAFFPAKELASRLAVLNSAAVDYLFKVALGRFGYPEFLVGTLNKVPIPDLSDSDAKELSNLAKRGWSLQRRLNSVDEISHAFLLPAALRVRLEDYDQTLIVEDLANIQIEIDNLAFDLYGFSGSDRAAALESSGLTDNEDDSDDAEGADDSEDDDVVEAIEQTDSLLSWAVGVAFSRFDWRLATGEREAPPEPAPFDPLPTQSPGMLPEGAAPFHAHDGILVDDQGYPHDLPRLIEEVLTRVDAEAPSDVRRWLKRDFFPLHLKQYCKSRRKAPIYWPLSTSSGSYTLWLYYPSLTSQTLYTAVNDFVEPKLEQVGRDAATLRDKGSARSSDDEKAFEALQALELELIELRDTLLHIAPTYQPNHDDGVQITAAPLWPLFRHKPWQKILRDTWAKLEKGDYDWAHLALSYWPDRVREKCKTDKSLAIAHDLEALYIEPEPKAAKARGRKTDANA